MSSQISEVVAGLVSNGPHRSQVGRKQLTLALGGLYIASTTLTAKPLLVWETETGYPRYYIPTETLHDEIKKTVSGSPGRGSSGVGVAAVETLEGAVVERLTVGSKATTWVRFLEGPLKGLVRFERSEIGWSIFFSLSIHYSHPEQPLRLRC